MTTIIRALALVLLLGAATVADAGGYGYRRSHDRDRVYGHPTAEGYRYVTPAGNVITVPYSAPVVVAPYGGTWQVQTPHGTNSNSTRHERSYQGSDPRCPRFFC